MTEILKFEREPCTRCGGSGEYSYCEMYGSTCFKCEGKGQSLTKRAKVAVQWMNRQNMIPAGEVKVGMVIRGCGWNRLTVKTIEAEPPGRSKSLRDGVWVVNPPGLTIRGEKAGITCSTDFEFQLIRSKQDHVDLLRKAIEYQNSLTKSGTPRKVIA